MTTATAGAAEVVDSVGITGSLAVVILLMVGAILYLVASARKQIENASAHAEAANQAVNNIGPGDHRMYDKIEMIRADVEKLVQANQDFAKRGWETLPTDLGTSAALTGTIRDLQHADRMIQHGLDDLAATMERIEKKLTDHVVWEESQKYPMQPRHAEGE